MGGERASEAELTAGDKECALFGPESTPPPEDAAKATWILHTRQDGCRLRDFFFAMGRRSLLAWWLLALTLAAFCHPALARARTGSASSKRIRKYRPTGAKSPMSYSPGEFIPGSARLDLNLTDVEEAAYYQSNYSNFPTAVYFPWNPRAAAALNDTEEAFVRRCFNATVTENKLQLWDDDRVALGPADRVMVRVISRLCLNNYGRSGAAPRPLPSPALFLLLGALCLSFAVPAQGSGPHSRLHRSASPVLSNY
ncbi:prion-like protein doppel [Rhinatrema bivittatum]|uniref:prion-like protein doppel n=1 Tax=Rhinatrema bivittatum TaxID=194408 RepID=UPI00112D70AB|nr:prion-like protein doppel [Rhinatrema bivittatum]